MTSLVLSLFPGIGLLDMAFEQEGFCVVRGPDVLWGGDVRTFHPPEGVFAGVIGGPPCQDFTPLASLNRSLGRESKFGNLIPEYERIVDEAQPEWWLMENVARAPKPCVAGYGVAETMLDNRWLGEEQARRRRFCFGTRDGRALVIENATYESTVVSTSGYQLGSGSGYWATPATAERRREAARRPVTRLAETPGAAAEFPRARAIHEHGKAPCNCKRRPAPDGARDCRRRATGGGP